MPDNPPLERTAAAVYFTGGRTSRVRRRGHSTALRYPHLSMTADEAVAAFSALPADRQIAVLARYAFEMTIVARGTYVPGTEEIADPQRLRLLNERQHRVTGHICHLLDGDTKRYDDDSIVRIVIAEDDAELLNAFEAAIRRCG